MWGSLRARRPCCKWRVMACAGKLSHVHADLGDDDPRRRLSDPGHRRQPVRGHAKRAQHLVGLTFELLHRRIQSVDLRQVQLEQETMMRRHSAVHRRDDVCAARLQASVGAIRQPLGIGLAGDDRREDRLAADAQDVGGNARQLDIRVFQRLLQPLRVPGDLSDRAGSASSLSTRPKPTSTAGSGAGPTPASTARPSGRSPRCLPRSGRPSARCRSSGSATTSTATAPCIWMAASRSRRPTTERLCFHRNSGLQDLQDTEILAVRQLPNGR